MSILDKLEKHRIYRAALEIVEYEEAYDKKRNVINGEELFKLCHERYLLLQQILLPLKEKLGKEVEITNISVAEGMQDDVCIIVEYLNNGKKCFFTLSHLEFDSFEPIFNTAGKNIKRLVDENKNVFLTAFDDVYRHSLDRELHILSTSKQFAFNDDNEIFMLEDSLNGETLNLCGNHLYYETMKSLFISKDKVSRYKNIAKLLTSDDNVSKVFHHVKVYEEDLPRVLVKK